MTIGQRIKQRRVELGLSADDVALALGKNRATIYRYESNDIEKLPTTVLEPLAEVLKTTPADLMGWDDSAKTVTPSVSIKDAVPFVPDGMIAFPIIGRVSAGMGSYADPENVVGTMVTDADKIIDGYDYVWLRVDGDSMEPELLDGDHVLVRVQDTAETGDLAVVLVDDENGVVKRIEYEEQNHITLISNNPKYTPRVFVREEMNRIRIFGKVVKMSRSF